VKLLTVGPTPEGPVFYPEARRWLKLPLLLAPALLILEALPGLAVVPGLARVRFNFGTFVTCFGFCRAE
jgi:heme A synthase